MLLYSRFRTSKDSSKDLRKVTTKHNKLTNAIDEAKAELMFRNSKIKAIRIPGF